MTALDAPLSLPAALGSGARRARLVLWLALGVAGVVALQTGAVGIGPGQVLAILGDRIGLALPWSYAPEQGAVLLALRLPRVLLAALVGAGLASTGAATQGLFRNPLADPALLGVASGAALAACAAIVLGAGALAPAIAVVAVPGAAFLGALAAVHLVWRLASFDGSVSVSTMLLAGIAVNALAGAGIGAFVFLADDAQLRNITFWQLGSLGGASWSGVGTLAAGVAVALLLLRRVARPLNALLLGEAEAGHLGVDVQRTKRAVVLATALATGAAVALVGVIGFVGLVVPHLVRLTLGPDHRDLVPSAALLGAILLVLADTLARSVAAPAEIPIGILTAAVGAPFFIGLLRARRAGEGR